MTEILQTQPIHIEEDKCTLDRIRTNALENFSKYGYVGASVREITAAAQVTKPTLYYYFQNKEELYRGLATSCFEKLLGFLKHNTTPSGTLSSRYCAFVQAYYLFCEKDFPAARFIQVISGTPARDVPDVGIEEFQKNIAEIIFGIVKDSKDAGEVSDEQQLGLQLILQGLFALAVDKRLKGLTLPFEELQRTLECLAFQKK